MKHSIYIFLLLVAVLGNSYMPAHAQVNAPNENYTPATPSSPLSYSLTDYTNVSLTDPVFNYKRVYKPLYRINDITSSTGLGYMKVNTTYENGWGKPILDIARGTIGVIDVMTPIDQRASLKKLSFLPYNVNSSYLKFQLQPFTDQQNFYSAHPDYSGEGGYSFSVSETEVNNTDNIVYNKQYAPGLSMAGSKRGTKTWSVYNSSADGNIWKWAGGNQPVVYGTYAYGEILIKITTGEHNAETREYYDKDNRLLCKKVKNGSDWLETHYIYNDVGSLEWVLPPKAVGTITGSGYMPSQAVRDNLCYYYKYNGLGQIIESKIPDQEYRNSYVYDRKHRLVMSQSPLLVDRGQWEFMVYDSRDRIVFTGILSSNDTRANWQLAMRGSATGGTISDYLINGYQGGSIPTSLANCQINTINYYDRYSNLPSPMSTRTPNTSYLPDFFATSSFGGEEPPTVAIHKTNGLMVGSQVRVLDPGNPNQWIYSVIYYDRYGKVLQTHTLNPWNAGNDWDMNLQQYDFSGNVRMTILEHHAWTGVAKSSTTVKTQYDYNKFSGKLEKVSQNTDNAGWRTIATYKYDKFRRANNETLGAVERQDYSYNIRGQLTGINKDYVTDVTKDNMTTFGEIVCYDNGFANKRYDGGIAGYLWRGAGRGTLPKAYGYGYDDAGRMTFADFNERASQYGTPPGTWGGDAHTAWNIGYDPNGNMTTMNQNDLVNTGGSVTTQLVDQMSYTYQSSSNRLDNVADAASYHTNDFADGNSGTDYQYDRNGNLTQDKNKGIDAISYNHMDLPETVNAGPNNITNIYDGAGNLLQKTIVESGTPATYRYWGPFVYKNNELQHFLHQEGRSRWVKDSSFFKEDFFVKDHLGNVRTVVTADITYRRADMDLTFEFTARHREATFFTNIDPVVETKPFGTPGDVLAGELTSIDPNKRIGPAIIVKARPGEQIDLRLWAYYEPGEDEMNNTYPPEPEMFGSLVNAFSGPGLTGNGENGMPNVSPATIGALLSPNNYSIYEQLKNDITDPNYPRMYLNYLVFDQNMVLDKDRSQVVQYQKPAGSWDLLQLNGPFEADQQGWVVAYTSNESARSVFIDHEHMMVIHGRLLEEQHYYPHGRLIQPAPQPIASLVNTYLYQGKKLQPELGLELYDFHARQYDANIGRFWGVDPMNEFPSGYTGMGNNPAMFTDPTGMKVDRSPFEIQSVDIESLTGSDVQPFKQQINQLMEGYMKREYAGLAALSFAAAAGFGYSGAGGGSDADGEMDNEDNYTLNADGSVKLLATTDEQSHSFYNSDGTFLFRIGSILTPDINTDIANEAVWSMTKIGMNLNGNKGLQVDMLDGATRNGWNFSAGLAELKRLGVRSKQMLLVDFVASFTSFPMPSQGVREGNPSSIVGIFAGKMDAGYGYITGGRDLQYDLTHPSNTAQFYYNKGVGLYNNYMNQLQNRINSYNNWRPVR